MGVFLSWALPRVRRIEARPPPAGGEGAAGGKLFPCVLPNVTVRLNTGARIDAVGDEVAVAFELEAFLRPSVLQGGFSWAVMTVLEAG